MINNLYCCGCLNILVTPSYGAAHAVRAAPCTPGTWCMHMTCLAIKTVFRLPLKARHARLEARYMQQQPCKTPHGN